MNPFRQEHILQRFGQTDCVAAMDNVSYFVYVGWVLVIEFKKKLEWA